MPRASRYHPHLHHQEGDQDVATTSGGGAAAAAEDDADAARPKHASAFSPMGLWRVTAAPAPAAEEEERGGATASV